MLDEDGKSILEESEKSEIVNKRYMDTILNVIRGATSSKKIDTPKGTIMQLSDGKYSVNIYNKDNYYVVNVQNTNFYSVIAEKDGEHFLYQNTKLGIEYKMSEKVLFEGVMKRRIKYNIKDIEYDATYLDIEGELSAISINANSNNTSKFKIYNEELCDLDLDELTEKIKEEYEEEYEEEFCEEEEEDELPANIEDFDFSKYEEQKAKEDDAADELIEEIDDLEKELSEEGGLEAYKERRDEFLKERYEELEEYYKDFKCIKEDEEIEDEEKIQYVQQAELDLRLENDEFFEKTDMIYEIISAYETELYKFNEEVAVERKNSIQDSNLKKDNQDSQDNQER